MRLVFYQAKGVFLRNNGELGLFRILFHRRDSYRGDKVPKANLTHERISPKNSLGNVRASEYPDS